MELRVIRMYSQDDFTIGALYSESKEGREFLCFTLEDEHRDEKVMGETRIPAGTYRITLRTVGGFQQIQRQVSQNAQWYALGKKRTWV